MAKIRKYANGIQRFLHGEKGQTFFNIVFSLGAAVVIWGALFKILHLQGGNLLLCIGMGTEIAMFILTAFDRPPKEYHWEDVFPELDPNGSEVDAGESKHALRSPKIVTVNGGRYPSSDYYESRAALINAAAQGTTEVQSSQAVSKELIDQIKEISERMAKLQETMAFRMESLNENITCLNLVYERQKKSVEDQLAHMDGVNRGLREIRDMYDRSADDSSLFCDETDRLVRNMRQLNSVYEKMISAMTVNMYGGYSRRRDSDASFERDRERYDRPENRED